MGDSRLAITPQGNLIWYTYTNTKGRTIYLYVSGMDWAGFDIDLGNVNSAYKVYFI